jgi:hypothetical protein
MESFRLNKRVFLICLSFVILFNLLPATWFRTGDFEFHFEKSSTCDGKIGDELIRCNSYYPLFHFFAGFFSFSKLAFTYFLFVLMLLVPPVLLFYHTKNWVAAWFYFSTTQFVYLVQTGGAYPQLLAISFLILFFIVKNNYWRVPLFLVAILSHSQAFFLLSTYWFLELAVIEFNKHDWKKVLPACSSIFGQTLQAPIESIQNVEVLNRNGFQLININIKDFINFFIRIFPLPFLVLAFFQLKKEKNWHIIIMVILLLYYGVVVNQSRVFWTIPILLIPALTRYYSNQIGWWRKSIIVLSIVTFAVNFGTWLMYKINCIDIDL